jgi:hypothetical protein
MLNRVGFSLSELSICGEPAQYRMVFKSENSEAVSYEITKAPVNASQRLQVFEIEEGVDVDFAAEGYYSYEIYQTQSNNLVEVGLLRVQGPIEQVQTVSTVKNPQVYVR